MLSKKTNPEREALIEAAVEHLRLQLEAQLPDGTATFAQIEAAAGRIGQSMKADLKQRLQEQQHRKEGEQA